MSLDRSRVYDSPEDFFTLNGHAVMKMTPVAAISVCEQAALRGTLIMRVEGGIWHHPGFESRFDCIWDGEDPPVDVRVAEENNRKAADFIRSECEVHDVFILTVSGLKG